LYQIPVSLAGAGLLFGSRFPAPIIWISVQSDYGSNAATLERHFLTRADAWAISPKAGFGFSTIT